MELLTSASCCTGGLDVQSEALVYAASTAVNHQMARPVDVFGLYVTYITYAYALHVRLHANFRSSRPAKEIYLYKTNIHRKVDAQWIPYQDKSH